MVYQNDENKELWLKCAPPLTGWLPCVSKSGKDLLRENLGSGKQATEHFMSAEQEGKGKGKEQDLHMSEAPQANDEGEYKPLDYR